MRRDFQGESFARLAAGFQSAGTLARVIRHTGRRAEYPDRRLRHGHERDPGFHSRRRERQSSTGMSRSIAPMSGSRTVPAFERSSGNVFRDLGFERPDDELARAMLIAQLGDL